MKKSRKVAVANPGEVLRDADQVKWRAIVHALSMRTEGVAIVELSATFPPPFAALVRLETATNRS